MNRVLIVPAAGLGTRLKSTVPKVLYPVNGRPMIDYLFERYAPVVDRFVLVLHPSFAAEVRSHCGRLPFAVDFAEQAKPTGMLDAILEPRAALAATAPGSVWITWCDQIAVRAETVNRLARSAKDYPDAAMILPTIERPDPYIHLERDERGVIRRVLQRRERDRMP